MVGPGLFGAILADPPWPERGGGRIKRGADRHYKLMSVAEIKALDISGLPPAALARPDAHLYLWATNNFLMAGGEVMRAWGFRYVTCITWAKDRIGLGQYFRGQTEHLLFGVRGRPGYRLGPDGKRAQGTTLVTAPRGKHSAKPKLFHRTIEHVSHGPYLELFARERVEGWEAWGDELEPEGP